jgi:hypothetical protein
MDGIGFAIAALLREEYRGVYGGPTRDGDNDHEEARLLAAELFT